MLFVRSFVLCRVLLHLARNDYTAAHSLSASLYASHPSCLLVVNNYAVCCLYIASELNSAVVALESLIRRDPIGNLHESVLSNLRALYDLAAPNPQLKRRMIEGLVIMYGSDDLETV